MKWTVCRWLRRGAAGHTRRAIAKIGRLILRGGEWDGTQLIGADAVRACLTPTRGLVGAEDLASAHIMPTPGWWTHPPRAQSVLPRHSYAGSGAGNQFLLIIPHLDMVIVRQGNALGDAHWLDYDRHVIRPILDACLPPYPPSETIKGVPWAPPETIQRDAHDSDTWPMTWADDDALYTAWADGFGFAQPKVEQKLSLGYARITGGPDDWRGENIRSETGEDVGDGAKGWKASGMLMVTGVLYVWARNVNRRGEHAKLGWSGDHARTWHWCDWAFEQFGYCTFANFGRNNANARDHYVYIYSHDHPSAYVGADRMILMRVPSDRITERAAYDFFAGVSSDGRPQWTENIAERAAVFEHPGRCLRSSVTYLPPLDRYLWWQQLPNSPSHSESRFGGGFGLYEAPEPWGPWRTVDYTEHWDVGPGETASIPAKWLSPDGRTFHLVFSGDDDFSVRRGEFQLAHSGSEPQKNRH